VRDAPVRSTVAIMALFGSLFWLGFLVWIVNLVGLRLIYSRLWHEHDHMQELTTLGQTNVRSTTGDSLGDMIEYLSIVKTEYLDALEFVLVAGVLPTMLVFGTVAFRGMRPCNRLNSMTGKRIT
jgi:hypothetical protein